MRSISGAVAAGSLLAMASGCAPLEPAQSNASLSAPPIETGDIDRFWATYDKVRATNDRPTQIALVQSGYLDSGSAGLKAFAAAKRCTAETYTDHMRNYPRFWDSLRARSLAARNLTVAIAPDLAKFRAVYPEMRPASVYFLVGCMTSAGTASGDKVMFGTELVMGNAQVDLSELPERGKKFFGAFYATDPEKGLPVLAIHEFVHTQQKEGATGLLAQTVSEGAADFVTERVTGKLPNLPYMTFGPANDAAIKARFQADLAKGASADGWLYTGVDGSPFGVRDLGYYVGYAIAKSYYTKAKDKRLALKQIIELDTTDAKTVENYVAASGYFPARAQ